MNKSILSIIMIGSCSFMQAMESETLSSESNAEETASWEESLSMRTDSFTGLTEPREKKLEEEIEMLKAQQVAYTEQFRERDARNTRDFNILKDVVAHLAKTTCAENSELKKKIDILSNEKSILTHNLNETLEEKDNLDCKLKAKEAIIKKLEQELDENELLLNQRQAEVIACNRGLSKAEDLTDELREELSKKLNEISLLRNELRIIKNRLEDLRLQLINNTANKQSGNSSNVELLEATKLSHEATLNENNRLEEDVNLLRSQLENQRETIEAITQERDKLATTDFLKELEEIRKQNDVLQNNQTSIFDTTAKLGFGALALGWILKLTEK